MEEEKERLDPAEESGDFIDKNNPAVSVKATI
jgi:hypothetical protein